MLKPEYLDGLPAAIIDLYSQVEQDILADMARRIAEYDYWIPAVEHQRQKLREMGLMQQDILRALSELTGKRQREIKRLMEEACGKALDSDRDYYRSHSMDVPTELSQELKKILAAGLDSTNEMFQNLTRTTASVGQSQFIDALDQAWMQIQSGAFDYNTAIRNAIKDISRQGLQAVRYPSGRTDTIETAVRRAVVTGVNQTSVQLQWQLADEVDCDLVETTAHAGARPSHAVWQGQIFSRSGKHPKYPDFRSSTGYGTGAGLGGWNCRHSFSPYVDGSPRVYNADLLEQYNAKKYMYNGKRLTEYEASQIQRYHERQIRRWMRENIAMQDAGQDAFESAAKIRSWQERQKDFIRQTGLKRQADREQIASFGKSQARKVTADVEKYAKIRYHKDGTIVVTDDWRDKGHQSTPSKYRPNAVIETISQRGKQIDRTIYDSAGKMKYQIHSGDHGHPKQHDYGKSGEHVHTYTWTEGQNRPKRTTRDFTGQERTEHADILEVKTDDTK